MIPKQIEVLMARVAKAARCLSHDSLVLELITQIVSELEDAERAKCEHCAETLDDSECETATITAYWVDADQVRAEQPSRICRECLLAGCSQPPTEGPGYIVEVTR